MAAIFTVEEVASALKTSKKSVLRMLRSKELSGRRRGRSWSVPKKSLRKWILNAIGMSNPRKTYKIIKENGIKVEENRGQVNPLNRYSLREAPTQFRGKLIHARDAAVELEGSFRYFARKFAKGNGALQDDLVQEMSLAVLTCDHEANRTFFIERAKSRAWDYLDHERIRGMAPLEDVKRHPFAAESIADEALLQLLVMAGIPVAAIANELGIAISPDVELDAAGTTKGQAS